jgi:hypothetical protein
MFDWPARMKTWSFLLFDFAAFPLVARSDSAGIDGLCDARHRLI